VKRDTKYCPGCKTQVSKVDFDKYDSYHTKPKCRKCEKADEDGLPKGKMKQCKRCKDDLPQDSFDKKTCRNRYDVCKACQHPICSKCGARRESIWKPKPKAKDPVPLCDKCEKNDKKKKDAGPTKRR